MGTELGIELVPVNADVGRRVAHAQQPRGYLRSTRVGSCERFSTFVGISLVHE